MTELLQRGKVMQPLPLKTRCFCQINANYPASAIKTEKMVNTWVVINDRTHTKEAYKILPCGHAVHERCEKIIQRLSQEFNETISCPMCEVDWTRPSEIHELELAEKNNPNIRYNHCLCDDKVRVFKNKSGVWSASTSSSKAYPCGHGCHKKCHAIFWKFANSESNNCPVCSPGFFDKKIESLSSEITTLSKELSKKKHLLITKERESKIALSNWDNKRRYITVGVLVISAVLIRFGQMVNLIQTPIPLTKFKVNELIVCIIAISISIFTSKLLKHP